MFPVRRVQREAAESLEQLGSKRRFWLTDDGRRVLFKAEERGTGEDCRPGVRPGKIGD